MNHRALTNRVPLPQARGRNHLCTPVQQQTRLHSSVRRTPTPGLKAITLPQFTELCSQQELSCAACMHACPGHEACERQARHYCTSAEAQVPDYSTSCDRNTRLLIQGKPAGPSPGFRAPQPKRLTPSCRTGVAEGKGMKLSLPGFGYTAQEVLDGLRDPSSPSLLASRHQMPQPAESTQRGSVLTQNGIATSKASFVGREKSFLDYQTNRGKKKKKKRPAFRNVKL